MCMCLVLPDILLTLHNTDALMHTLFNWTVLLGKIHKMLFFLIFSNLDFDSKFFNKFGQFDIGAIYKAKNETLNL